MFSVRAVWGLGLGSRIQVVVFGNIVSEQSVKLWLSLMSAAC